MAKVFELTPNRRGERRDRRQASRPVEVDRRQGDRRHFPADAAVGNG
jgi:hypothetical protein